MYHEPKLLETHLERNLKEYRMCGIVGYIGSAQAAPLLLEGLERLEYRGYDSAGVAVLEETPPHGKIQIQKSVGRSS